MHLDAKVKNLSFLYEDKSSVFNIQASNRKYKNMKNSKKI